MRGPRWSDEDTQSALAMFAAGSTPAEIGRELGRTRSAVRNRLERERTFVPAVEPGQNKFIQQDCRPDQTPNRDGWHVARVLAQRCTGFPAFALRATYRVAA